MENTKPISDSSILKRFKRSEDRFTLLAALNYKGFLPDACLKIDRTKDNVDIDLFNYYLVNFLIPAMGNFSRGEENSILIIDNAPIHDQLEITRLVEEAGGIVIFTARYSPDINPTIKPKKSTINKLISISAIGR